MLDSLHANGIEIVSPSFMNTRPLAEDRVFIPDPSSGRRSVHRTQAEDIAFDKADEAASVEDIRKRIELVDARLETLEDNDSAERSRLEKQKAWLSERLKAAEDQRRAAELAEQAGSSS
jgi:hypothetical protein